MATYTGKEGVIKIGANDVAEVRNFTITESAETVDNTAKGDDWRKKKVTFKSWAGELDAWVEDTDTTGQDVLVVGAEITLGFYPIGDASGAAYKSGSALITERQVKSELEGMVELAISVEGNGPLADGAVP